MVNFLEWNKIFMVAEDNPKGLNRYKDLPAQLANKLPEAKKTFTKKKHVLYTQFKKTVAMLTRNTGMDGFLSPVYFE
jgi:hypothetical protein